MSAVRARLPEHVSAALLLATATAGCGNDTPPYDRAAALTCEEWRDESSADRLEAVRVLREPGGQAAVDAVDDDFLARVDAECTDQDMLLSKAVLHAFQSE